MKINNFPDESAYSGIHVFNETELSLPQNSSIAEQIAHLVEEHEKSRFQLVEIVFVDEHEIIRINKEHLKRDYVTDIISFRYDDGVSNATIEGTLFCCLPRIFEQAQEFNASRTEEFNRIIIHGLLHLTGYEDKSNKQRKKMQERENFYLQKLN